ncbi:hypothetical protein [Streptomyces sp. CFMR 7]|uniref:hypothetical protein n=1 Tax=Streptomyces sp. CFMR 7 TaxID=1649184 RepID=UPI0011A5B2AA|nr:hypothetical protein [Streptomyces sp. CFMR 7]
MFRIVRTSTWRELIAQAVHLHNRAEHWRLRALTAEHTNTRKDPAVPEQPTDSFVTTQRTTPTAVTTVIVTPEGATAHDCPGGLTEDDLVD